MDWKNLMSSETQASSLPSTDVWPPPPAGFAVEGDLTDPNTSGTDREIPAPIAGLRWNWAAFALNWLWLVNHRMVAAGVILGLLRLPLTLLWVLLDYFCIVVSWTQDFNGGDSPLTRTQTEITIGIGIALLVFTLVDLWLGRYGHRIAWRRRRYLGTEDYILTETVWRKWAAIYAIVTGAVNLAALSCIVYMSIRDLRH